MVAVLGPQWLTAKDAHGKRRLDYEYDTVRCEITAALDRNITIIPVIVPRGTIPAGLDLPYEMRGFERCQALTLSLRQWDTGVEELNTFIKAILERRA
jgi:hypothetical protein